MPSRGPRGEEEGHTRARLEGSGKKGCNPNLQNRIRVQRISFTTSHCYTLEFNDVFQSGYQILQAAFDSEMPSQRGGALQNTALARPTTTHT